MPYQALLKHRQLFMANSIDFAVRARELGHECLTLVGHEIFFLLYVGHGNEFLEISKGVVPSV